MKRILITILLLSLLPFGVSAGPARSKVAVIRVESSPDFANQQTAWDYTNRYGVAIDKILSNRGIDAMYFTYDGDTTRLKVMLSDTFTAANNIEFAVFYGGWGDALKTYTNDTATSQIWRFVEPGYGGGAYCSVNAFWWSYAINSTADYDIGVTGAAAISENNAQHFYTPSYDGCDTFYAYPQTSGTYGYVTGPRNDTPEVDSILTYTDYPDDDGKEHYMGVWSTTRDGLINYYTSMIDGTVNLIVDAIICKNVTYFDPLYYAWDIDDFGMHNIGTAAGDTYGTLPTGTNYVNLDDTLFWDNIGAMFQAIEDYDMKLTIGAVAKGIKTTYADSNQWGEWVDIATTWGGNSHFAWVWHNHGLESVDDSTTALFIKTGGTAGNPSASTYRHFNITEGSAAVTVARMDSLYEDACDSLRATFGVEIAPYIIPPYDNVDGTYGDLKDIVAEFCASNGLAIRSKAGDGLPYLCSREYNGAKVLVGHYSGSTAIQGLILDTGKANAVWNAFFNPNFYRFEGMVKMSPGVASALTWYNVNRTFGGYGNYEAQNSRINILHFAGCYGDDRNTQFIGYIGEHIAFLEDLAGKDLYECKFAYELAQDPKCWRQVKR